MKSLIGVLFQSRLQSHIWHLQTNKYNTHIILEEYYDSILNLIDKLVETYQNEFGIIYGYTIPKINDLINYEKQIIEYFENINKLVMLKRQQIPQRNCLLAIVDEIQILINQTLYKLKNLK